MKSVLYEKPAVYDALLWVKNFFCKKRLPHCELKLILVFNNYQMYLRTLYIDSTGLKHRRVISNY